MQIFWKRSRLVALSIGIFALMGIAGAPRDLGSGARSPSGDESSPRKPGQSGAAPADYAGATACAACHSEIYKTQKATDMANTAMRPAESVILHQHPALSVEQGPYTYALDSAGKQVNFSVSDGHGKISAPVVLAVGTGIIHQLYLIEHKGAYYQVPISYYSRRARLLFVGKPSDQGATLEAALGERLTNDRIHSCLGCHGTLNGIDAPLESDRLVLGVQCEACHGPGARHVAVMRAGHGQKTEIFNPAQLDSSGELEFCGRCHPYQSVKNGSVRGIAAVASQAYRLTESRCWLPNDKRSRCTFCHNPHTSLKHEAYDAPCLSCHPSQTGVASSQDAVGKPCPVSKQNCAGCHMPQVEIPGSNDSYTDHRIRIVRPGAAFPE